MGSINNHFPVILTSPLTLLGRLIIVFLAFAHMTPAMASDPIFTIEDVVGDVTAENAIAAREKAFEEAQVKAFEELTLRMLPDADLATTKPPAPNIISTMIQDFEVTNEQLSAVRYIGTYTFRFRDREVRRYFAKTGTTISDVSSEKLLVLPFLNKDSRNILWTPGNVWMQAWNRVPSLSGLVPLEVPIGDISDVRDIGDGQALTYNVAGLSKLLSRYGAAEAAITIATPDDQLLKITNPEDTAIGRLDIEIYRTDRNGPELVQQVTAIADGAQTRAQLYDRGVMLVRSALQKDWKAKTAIRPTTNTKMIRLVVPIESLNDWIKIQTNLSRMSALTSIDLKSLTPRQANVEIRYKGGEERLSLTLAQAGLEIEQTTASDGSPIKVLTSSRYQPTRF